MTTALVVGAGPAGLMAADVLASAGVEVTIAEAKPSPARKFLMAGKSGLNLTKNEPKDIFVRHFNEAAPSLQSALHAFGPNEVAEWAKGLGQDVFTGSTGRVFPKTMKASPLLRAWLARLEALGATLNRRWRWTGWDGDAFRFETPQGMKTIQADAAVLACGGASWARLGSDGMWAGSFPASDLSRFRPANMGFDVNWSNHMSRHFGQPVKGIALRAGSHVSRGEIVLTQHGIEGGGVYAISRPLRDGVTLTLDLMPDVSAEAVRARLSKPRGKTSLSNHLRKTLRFDPVRQALLMEFARPLPKDLAAVIKALPVPLVGPRPMDEAISTAGGLKFDALDDTFMLKNRPGVFATGEMLDWEAPTGGYLITACLATGQWAGRGAASWVAAR
ncbi:TIGR03862 family flavoprotein [Roseovarius phycicola]|uniref:TIGR03862 family flavoprotein n=1 Tax=Roseovarius phycicola TaxID=3080976 RepID=A0ABZ2HJ42_9RHOB